jgi:hypothetical protein
MIIDSKHKTLNFGEIISHWVHDNPNNRPDAARMTAILAELSHPNVETKQFGNTIFELIKGRDRAAYIKAINSDTAPNFIANLKLFLLWCKHVHGLRDLITRFNDPDMTRMIVATFNKAPAGMTYKLSTAQSGATQLNIHLGD